MVRLDEAWVGPVEGLDWASLWGEGMTAKKWLTLQPRAPTLWRERQHSMFPEAVAVVVSPGSIALAGTTSAFPQMCACMLLYKHPTDLENGLPAIPGCPSRPVQVGAAATALGVAVLCVPSTRDGRGASLTACCCPVYVFCLQ